ncbi:hypothetical protein CYJ27_02765 [Aerococcus christensenii]|uniref:ABC transporter permease n=1 Tax=Aerococcus christensenii TaxID=87541 RepID=A0A0X8F926_9LACT|nr:ECF transporter S component [Aerococcus christensenii]AMB92884.1 hypothetical protein AWM71_06150 [Aerococcus christensenii]KXB34529.1 hypothetical protein HMPREF3187_01297 [Aerococcus christensenii]MDK8233915.1 ECF transporter S component [Aerococcus christensenii]PKY91615.1 hypothetical protein CYJ27_02765 [Aerococcus christensenii]WEB71491.1 ECF transporter S component [Aerococcus christensenii]
MKKDLTTKDYVFTALLSVVFGIIYFGTTVTGTAITAALTPLGLGMIGYEFGYGIWYMAAIVAIHLIKRPFVGTITEVIAALIEVLLGSTFGPMVFVTGIIQGVAAEAPYAIKGYKDYSYKTSLTAGFLCGVVTFLWSALRHHYWTMEPKIIILVFIVRIISALFFTGFLAKFICDRLYQAGVIHDDDEE